MTQDNTIPSKLYHFFERKAGCMAYAELMSIEVYSYFNEFLFFALLDLSLWLYLWKLTEIPSLSRISILVQILKVLRHGQRISSQ